jgi:Na+/H+-dicarboxylate symporter
MLYKLKNRTLQTLIIITLYILFAESIPLDFQRGLYTASILIKDSLIWIMPLTVCAFIAHTVDSFEHKAPLFILILLLFETSSNMLSVWYSYIAANMISSQLPNFELIELKQGFKALWTIPFTKPSWWGADKGSLAGLVLGLLSATVLPQARSFLTISKNVFEGILTKIFVKLIPIYILGFIAQIHQSGMLNHMMTHYGMLIIYLLFFTIIYLFLIFFIGTKFSISGTFSNIKNLMPAGLIALASGCSLSTMPWTIQGAGKNLRDPELAKALIPATTNIQQIGDCIANAFLCYLIYYNFFGLAPDILTWSIFTLVFVAARFATIGVRGGAIFVMLPIYQTYLNFNDEMIAIILALNVILDPIITSCNVIANGGLAKIFENIWVKLSFTGVLNK